MSLLCKLGIHQYPIYVTAYWQAPAPIRCDRCRKKKN